MDQDLEQKQDSNCPNSAERSTGRVDAELRKAKNSIHPDSAVKGTGRVDAELIIER